MGTCLACHFSGGHSCRNELLMFHTSNHTRLSKPLASCVFESYSHHDVRTLYAAGDNWGAVGPGLSTQRLM
jgi:hypothetical protein